MPWLEPRVWYRQILANALIFIYMFQWYGEPSAKILFVFKRYFIKILNLFVYIWNLLNHVFFQIKTKLNQIKFNKIKDD
jgi:hypothetical protein